jgi:hypothetical protein
MVGIALVALLGGATACSSSGSMGQGASTGGGGNGGSAQMASNVPSSATTWCMRAPERSRCMGRASVEHSICIENPETYDSCRFAMDQMHGA